MGAETSIEAAVRKLAGGDENITFSHATDAALTLTVKDQGLVKTDEIKALGGVRSCELADGALTVAFINSKEENMASKFHDFAGDVLANVGGKGNVNNLAHCITRLRFKLKDESKADKDALTALDGVITVIQAGGQYQVVVGDKVDDVYDALINEFGVPGAGEVPEDDAADEEKPADKNPFNRLMDIISGSMGPTLMTLAAAGMLKGLAALFLSLGWLDATSGFYMIMYAAGDAFFYFLPIIIGYSASKKFGLNEFIGMAIGATLVYPNLVNLAGTASVLGTVLAGTPFAMNYYNTFLGIPVIFPQAGYTSSIIPIIVAVWVASHLEGWLKKVIPSIVRNFLVPVCTLGIMVPLTYLAIGPIAGMISGVINLFVQAIYNIPVIGAPLAGALIGGAFSTLVMFGLHWALIPIWLNTFALVGFDYTIAVCSFGGFVGAAQGLAVLLKTKSDRVRGITIPATVSQLCGIGEPILYGLQIPSKFLFYQDIALSAIGGLVGGILHVKQFAMGGMGFFGFPNYIDPVSGDMTSMIEVIVITAVLMVAGFVLTMMTYSDEKAGFAPKEKKVEEKTETASVAA